MNVIRPGLEAASPTPSFENSTCAGTSTLPMKPVLSFNIKERRCKSMSKTMPTTAHPLRSCAQIGVCKQQLYKQYTRTKRRRQFRISVVSDSNHPDLGFNFFGCAPLSLHRLKLPYRCETVRRSGVPRTPEATAATLLREMMERHSRLRRHDGNRLPMSYWRSDPHSDRRIGGPSINVYL